MKNNAKFLRKIFTQNFRTFNFKYNIVKSQGMVRVFRLDDSQLKAEPKSSAKVNEFFDFISLAWVHEFRMLLGTSQGQIVIWEDGSLISDVLDPSASLSLHSMKVSYTVRKFDADSVKFDHFPLTKGFSKGLKIRATRSYYKHYTKYRERIRQLESDRWSWPIKIFAGLSERFHDLHGFGYCS